MKTFTMSSWVCASALLAAAPMNALAQDIQSSGLSMEEVITIGTAKPKQKIESTNATTTFNSESMERLAPMSVGELVRSIPGLHAEDTGGETGNNIAPRGFPLTTQMEFTALHKNGMAVFYDQDILFTQADRFTRVSSFIGNVEAIRGGASSVYAGSAPAGYINFISREGSDEVEGDITLETNSNNRLGFKGWVSGPINDQTTYAIGGWWRQDDSGRDPGYVANQGGEIDANVKYEFRDGSGFTKFEYNAQNDKSFFFIPQPLTGSTKNPKTIPGGMDIRDGTTGNSVHARTLNLNNTPSGDINLDVTDGNFADVMYFGNTTEWDFGNDWTVKNQFRYTDLYATFTGIINVGNASLLSGRAQDIFDNNSAALAGAMVGSDLTYQIREAGSGIALADNTNVDSWNTNGMGIDAGFWHRRFDGDNFQNDLRFQNAFNDSLYTTFGLFFSNLNGHVTDYRINTLQSIERLPQRLDIVYMDGAGNDIASGTYNGIQAGSHGFANATFTERTFAPYVDFEYEVGDLTLNFGARYEKLEATGDVENGADYAISSFASDTDAVNGNIELPFGTGSFRSFDLEYSEFAWTAAANYKVSDTVAVFGRYAKGFRMPDVDKYMQISGLKAESDPTRDPDACSIQDFRSSNCPLTEPTSTVMAELGVKYSDGGISAFVTAYFAAADDLSFNVPTVVNGVITNRDAFRSTETLGLEMELAANIIGGWHVGVSATYQDPEFVDTPAAEFIDGSGNVGSVDINGKIPVRVPEHFGQLTTRYDFEETPWGYASINASYTWSGRRYADDANTAELPGYGMLNLGASLETDSGFYIRGDVKNLNNSEGLSEGDPRAGETVAGQTATFNARVLLPRTFSLSVGKRF
ncbi:MAG: TonB-dependent receptor [Gammaproteobacteria bacterium]|uniref:TonB-dependent receptor n=1 Tax=Pseudomaricurvus alcaniphilus TaxID=1166482 RepID=UPI001408662F|nr:TonB-dependent receptor [Pseudomaricurvus alcaniphilus]MBR9911471.1 TonB-dependent receptor [Gammaproteobacteria bacterium]NHN36783.1 TonB-dependent receptor [Pseudomaricurvus alcaniphilus]